MENLRHSNDLLGLWLGLFQMKENTMTRHEWKGLFPGIAWNVVMDFLTPTQEHLRLAQRPKRKCATTLKKNSNPELSWPDGHNLLLVKPTGNVGKSALIQEVVNHSEEDLYIYQFQETAFLEHLATLMGVKQPLVQRLAHKIWNVGHCKIANGIRLQVVVSFLMKEVEALRGLRSVVVKGIGPAIYLCPPSTIGTHNRTTNLFETCLPIDPRTIEALEQNQIFCRALDDFVSWDKGLGVLVATEALDGSLNSLAIPQNVTQSESLSSISPEKEPELEPYVFILDEESDRWQIRFSGKDVQKVKNSKGLRLLKVLISKPNCVWNAKALERESDLLIVQNMREAMHDNDSKDYGESDDSGDDDASHVDTSKISLERGKADKTIVPRKGIGVNDRSTPEARALYRTTLSTYERYLTEAKKERNDEAVHHWVDELKKLNKFGDELYGSAFHPRYDDDIEGSQVAYKRVVLAIRRGIAAIAFNELPYRVASGLDKAQFLREAKLKVLEDTYCPCATYLRDTIDWVSLAYLPANKAVEWYT